MTDSYQVEFNATQLMALTNRPAEICISIASRLTESEFKLLMELLKTGVNSKSVLHIYEAYWDLQDGSASVDILNEVMKVLQE
jgi:hypothetical protein